MIHQILGGLCLVVALFLVEWLCQRKAWERGYEKGWKAAAEFIVKLESDVDQERQKIWREER